MSPQRRKGRGGGGGKTIAPLPSSLIPSPSSLTHIPSKSCSFKERRHATSVHPIIVSDNSAVKLKPQLPHGSRHSSSDRASAAAPSLDPTKNLKNFVTGAEKHFNTTSVSESCLKARSSSAMRPRTTDQEKSKTNTETELRPAKPRSSSAVKPRLHTSDQPSRDSSSSIRTVRVASDTSTSIVATRRASVPRIRAESRPRTGRASSPSLVRKEGPDRQASNELRARMCTRDVEISQRQKHSIPVSGADAKRVSAAKGQFINGKEEEGKRVSSASAVFYRLDGTSCSTTTLETIASKSCGLSMYQKENKTGRWSTTALPVALPLKINGKLGLAIERATQGNPRTKGKHDVPPSEEKFSSSAIDHPSRTSIKLSCEMEERISTNKSAALSSQISSNSASEDALQVQEVQSIDSTSKCGTFRVSLKGKEPDTITSSSTGNMLMEQHGIKDECGMSCSLHRRLAHLEGKVSQIAAELKRTRSLLDSDDFAASVSVLSDIHNKIATIERAMTFPDCDDIASLDDVIMEDEFPTVYKEENARNSYEHFGSSGTEITSKARLQGSISAPPRFSQLNRDQRELEDRLLPHGQLLKSRLSLSAVGPDINLALYAEVVDASIQVNLEGSKPTSLKDISSGTTEKFSEAACTEDADALNNGNSLRSSAQSLISTGDVENKQMESDARPSHDSEMQLPSLSAENSRHYLQCDETLPSNSFHENVENVMNDDGIELAYAEDVILNELCPIGDKVAVAGWYASEGEAILLAHDDGSCSYHDVANMEEKVVYGSPDGIAMPLWNDCWLVRAAGSDGRSNKYVVVATAGSATGSGFCSWDFYNKTLSACHIEDQWNPPSFTVARGSKSYSASNVGTEYGDLPRWWYNPSGPLLASVSSSMKRAVLYDIRDGETVLEWDINTDVAKLDYCSPVQWRERGKLVIAELEAISIWDVNTMNVDCLQSISIPRKRISAICVYNSDAECSGGVRQRLSSSETEAFDGICCTQDDINVLDFRVPNGIGISFPNPGHTSQCVYARQDMVLVGGLDRELNQCRIQQWSVRKGMQFCAYAFDPSGAQYTPHHHIAVSQVWGSPSLVMAVNGDGLSIFKTGKQCEVENVKDVVTSQDLSNPSFDYSNSRVLLISRDRPACWSFR